VSEQAFYRWYDKHSGSEVNQVRELKQGREENVRLKRIVVDLTLGKAMLQDVLSRKFWGSRSAV
jgi:putative transposase